MDKKYKVEVNDSLKFDLKSSNLKNLDILKLSDSNYHVLKNNKSFDIKLLESNFNNKVYSISVNSTKYSIKISNQLDILIEEMGFSLGSSKKENTIKAPMPGLILNINVTEGQEVKEGETLVVLEAMKMENAIEAPNDGIIKSIFKSNGETVEKGELMIELK